MRITEEQFIVISDLEKIKNIRTLLTALVPFDCNEIKKEDLKEVHRILSKWEGNLTSKLSIYPFNAY